LSVREGILDEANIAVTEWRPKRGTGNRMFSERVRESEAAGKTYIQSRISELQLRAFE